MTSIFQASDNRSKLLNPVTQKDAEGAGVQKFTIFIYIYSASQFFIALKSLDTNPKYFYSLTGRSVDSRWKLIPLALFESCMSASIASAMLFYLIFFVSYVTLTKKCIDILR